MADALTHKLCSQRTDLDVLDIPSPQQAVVDVYDPDLNAERGQDLLDILPSGEIDLCLSLRVDFTVILHEDVKKSVEASTTAVGTFKGSLRCWTTLGDPSELLGSVDWLRCAILSSNTQVQSLWRETSLESAELDAVRSEDSQVEGPPEAVNSQLLASQGAFTLKKSDCQQT